MTILSGNKKGAFLALQGMLGKPAYVPIWPVPTSGSSPAQYAISLSVPDASTWSSSIWVRVDSYGPEAFVYPAVISGGHPGQVSVQIALGRKSTNPNAWNSEDSTQASSFNAPSNDIGVFHSIISSNGQIYLDGILVSSVATLFRPSNSYTTVGQSEGNDPATSADTVAADTPMIGVITNFMVVPYVLTAGQISQIYKLGPSATADDYKSFGPLSLYAVPEEAPPKIMKDYGSAAIDLSLQNGLSYGQTKGIGTPGLAIAGFDLGIKIQL